MEISLTDAKAQLTELVRRAEAGDDVILTRHGKPAVRLTPVVTRRSPEAKRRVIEEIQKSVQEKNLPAGPCAARSQDFLYGEDGLPA
jgi:prevent-host-death family protein